jgi:hypothetical protein
MYCDRGQRVIEVADAVAWGLRLCVPQFAPWQTEHPEEYASFHWLTWVAGESIVRIRCWSDHAAGLRHWQLLVLILHHGVKAKPSTV